MSSSKREQAALAFSENEGGLILPAERMNMLLTAGSTPPVKIGDASIIGPLEAHHFMMNRWPHVKAAKVCAGAYGVVGSP